MSDNYNQFHTPQEKGHLAGVRMGLGDSATLLELDLLIGNPHLDPTYRDGLVAGRHEARRQRTAYNLQAVLETRDIDRGRG